MEDLGEFGLESKEDSDLAKTLDELDKKSLRMLRAVERRDGEATTTEIRKLTGLENSSVNYRYDGLEDRNLIEVEEQGYTEGGRRKPKLASLTEEGERFVEYLKESEKSDYVRDVEELNDEIERLRVRIKRLEDDKQDIKRTLNAVLNYLNDEHGISKDDLVKYLEIKQD